MNDKVSRYNIEVEHTNCMILYNSLTHTHLPVCFEEYAMLETLLEHLEEFQKRYPDLYTALKKTGFIVPSDFDELAYIKLQNKKCIYGSNDYRITINPTLDCNLKCWYCSVEYAGAVHTRERMSNKMVDSLKNHIHDLVIEKKARSVQLDWFGGEPLMYFEEVISKISDFVQDITNRNQVKFGQQITTNGILLNESRIRKMKDSLFKTFQIPLDGNENRHNLIKRSPDKSNNYRKTVNNINLIADIIPNATIFLRINYDKKTLINIRDIINDLSEQSKHCITVDFQRIWQITCTDKERKLLKEAKEEFTSAGFHSAFWAYRPNIFHCCYADRMNYYLINYDGNIFKCTARDYGESLAVGNLLPSGKIAWNDKLLSKMYEKSTFENEKCENCNILPLCMGPCIQKNFEARKNNQPILCTHENVEYGLNAYIIETAKNKDLIK